MSERELLEQGILDALRVQTEISERAAAYGLDAELKDVEEGWHSFSLWREREYVGTVYYLEGSGTWTDVRPGGEGLDTLLSSFRPAKTTRREVEYVLNFNYGRRNAPKALPEAVVENVLDAAVKMAKTVAPDAVKVTVSSRFRSKTAKLS